MDIIFLGFILLSLALAAWLFFMGYRYWQTPIPFNFCGSILGFLTAILICGYIASWLGLDAAIGYQLPEVKLSTVATGWFLTCFVYLTVPAISQAAKLVSRLYAKYVSNRQAADLTKQAIEKARNAHASEKKVSKF